MRLIAISVAWVLGISLARPFPSIETAIWVVFLATAMCFAIVWRRQYRLRWFAALLAAFAAGGARQSLLPRTSEIAAYNGYSGTVTGLVVSEPDIRDDRIQLRVEAESAFVNNQTFPTGGLILVEAPRSAEINYGDRIRATGALATPATWDTFSYADYLGRQGVFTLMRNAGVEVIGAGYGSPVWSLLLELKQIVRGEIAKALPEPSAGLLTGILLGDERGISPTLAEDFQRVGASHIVAISGFNMVIVSAVVIAVLSSIFPGKSPWVTVSAITVIAVYSLFVGGSASIMRAALMSSLLIIGKQLNRRTFVPTSLAFAALLLSFGDPNVLLDVGFQLSFLAVLGLGLFTDPLSRKFRSLLDRVLPAPAARTTHVFLNEPLIVSIAAQITTLPLIVLYFGRLSLVALPVNLLIVPVQAAVLLLGLAAVFVQVFVPVLGMLIFWANLVFLSWTIAVVRGFSQLEIAESVINLDGRLIQILYLLLLGGAMIHAARPPFWKRFESLIRRERTIVAVGTATAILLILMGAMALSRPDGRLHVWLLDVGHSNGVLVQTPGGAHILVDGGRYPSRLLTAIGDRLPFYDREIEIIAITHPDEWDIAALNSVLDRYTVGAALYHGQPNRGETFQQIMTRLTQAGVSVVEARAGYRLEFSDGVHIEVLHPFDKPSISDKLGDSAMVLRVRYGDASFLLTSDLSIAAQRAMLDTGTAPVSTVMQIPQHGTIRALDSAFLAQAQPQVALLQSDIANRRGDPDPDTLAQLDNLPLFRTDEMGTIHLSSDGRVLQIHQ